MDEDAVNTLSALYITHTVGLIEAIRYVKMKQVLNSIDLFVCVTDDIVFEFDLWVSWDFDGSCTTCSQFSGPRSLGPKSRFRNV